MIRNNNCAYCGVILNKIENDPHCASVEHMIPNIASRNKRNNDQGDYLVCRRCNINKSRMDEIIGLTTRLSIDDEDLKASKKYIDRVSKNDKLFKKALESIEDVNGEIGISIPITPRQAIEYFEYYGKGQYLICNGQIFNDRKHVILVDIMGYSIVRGITNRYREKNLSDPFEDLMKNMNEGISNLEGDTFIICSSDASDMMIFFNKSLLIKINIRGKTMKTLTEKNKLRRRLYNSWNKY